MSWLNFNDSLNNLKGQISNFANTVLAEDNLEIQNASEVLHGSDVRKENKTLNNEFKAQDSWRWSTDESKTDQLKTDETITNLKKRIVELENENRDLITSLDQLDQNHQQNTEELVKMKSKLGEELEIVTDKYENLNMKYNKLALAENAYKKKINELKSKCDELSQQNDLSLSRNESDEASSKCKKLELENERFSERVSVLETANKSLEILLQDANSAIDSKLSEMSSTMQELETENKALRIALQSKKEIVDEDVIERYESKIKNLENEVEFLRKDKTQFDNEVGYKITIEQLQNELKNMRNKESEIEKSNLELEESRNELKETIIEDDKLAKEMYEERIQNLEDQLKKLNDENSKNKIEMEENIKKYQLDKEELQATHNEFQQILNEHFREYLTDDIQGDLNVSKFSVVMKKMSNLLMNLETKCNALETKIFELNQSKTDLQNEKNAEIERLLQNSEMLTQELLKRSKEIKDLEEECSQLMKNNDLLINKLTESKDTGLQTIFESNEDNVDVLEKQLEIATKKIGDLEGKLSDRDSSKNLNITGLSDDVFEKESSLQSDTKYCELEEKFFKLQEENVSFRNLIEDLKQKLDETETERDNCRVVIDKMRVDFETTEYQFAEMNINLETLSEEIEKHKLRIDSLVVENEKLKSMRDLDLKNGEALRLTKEELSRSIQHNNSLQAKIEEINEQYNNEIKNEKDTSRKEIEVSLVERDRLKKDIEEASNNYIELQSIFEKCRSENYALKNLHSNLCKHLGINENHDEFKSDEIVEKILNLTKHSEMLQNENGRLSAELHQYQAKSTEFVEKELHDLRASRDELITIVQTKHQEAVTYHAEVQRLTEILRGETEKNIQLEKQIEALQQNVCSLEVLNGKNEEIEKMEEQISFLKQKCDVLAQNMLEEQQKVANERSSSSEREATLSKKLERLQTHLMEVEEHYTQELLQSEQKIALIQARLNEVEQREKDSSTIYTSVSIRANQQNEALQQQLQTLTSQRDEFKRKLLDLEDENNVKSAALTNLQLVLEQFQRDKEADVIRETDRIRRQVKQEQKVQEDLKREITNLETQLKESKQGIQAALRLTDQLEMSKNQIFTLREEVTVLTEKLNKKEEELKTVTSQTDGKVDKSLIKNLIIGFVTTNKNFNKDQMQILKIIATVLDFNEQEHNKVNLNQAQQNSWLRSLLTPLGDELPPHESLSRAFVNFLENESKPRVIPSLLPGNSPIETPSSISSSRRTTPTPIVLNEIVLPTFSDFPQHRNSSSILKGVLKDNP